MYTMSLEHFVVLFKKEAVRLPGSHQMIQEPTENIPLAREGMSLSITKDIQVYRNSEIPLSIHKNIPNSVDWNICNYHMSSNS